MCNFALKRLHTLISRTKAAAAGARFLTLPFPLRLPLALNFSRITQRNTSNGRDAGWVRGSCLRNSLQLGDLGVTNLLFAAI
jgi:hypothetical protein